MRHATSIALAAALLIACRSDRSPTAPAAVAPSAAKTGLPKPYTEPAFYAGRLVHFLLPSATSNDPNDQVIANCFRVGPRVPSRVPIRANVYVLIIPGANQEEICSTTGQPTTLVHNHVFGAAPGDPNYDGHFRLVIVGPGPNYPGAAFAGTFNSEAAVRAGIAAGELAVLAPDAAHVHWIVKL